MLKININHNIDRLQYLKYYNYLIINIDEDSHYY